jgi:hypothetical protein
MTSADSAPYEPPKIDARERIDVPLIGNASLPAESAVFRPSTAYEPPRIVERSAIGVPLVALVSSPDAVSSAVFRPLTVSERVMPDERGRHTEEYEPPQIDARERIDVPLIGLGSQSVRSAVFRPTTAYEQPKIEARDPIIGVMGAVGSVPLPPP